MNRIDRRKTTPTLIRVFIHDGNCDYEKDYYYELYVWRDSSLRDVSDLLKENENCELIRRKDCSHEFSVVYKQSEFD
jgi:hypothetical protein